jgi:hypothetical protein
MSLREWRGRRIIWAGWYRLLGMKRPIALTALSAGLVAGAAHLGAQSPSRRAARTEPCYLIAVGPAVGNPHRRMAIPAVIAFRSAGRVAGALGTWDTLFGGGDRPVGSWRALGADSLLVWWQPAWLGGSLELRLAREGRELGGRYALHGHQADDGRGLPRGSALA